MLELKVTNQDIKLTQVTPYGSPLVSGSAGEYECRFEFDETWQGFIKTAVFEYTYTSFCAEPKHEIALLEDDACTIPARALRKGGRLRIGVYGIKNEIVRPTVYTDWLLVRVGAMPVTPENDPTPEIYIQILNMMEKVGIPKGGTTDQVLAKKSDKDYDVEWVDQTGGSGGASSWSKLKDKPFDELNPNELEVNGLEPNRQLGVKEIPTSKVIGLDTKLSEVDSAIADKQPKGDYATRSELPTKLPSPYNLRFTGAVVANYDGGEEVTVDIPQGGGSANVLIVHSEDKLVADKNAVEINNAANDGYEVIFELQKKYRYNLYYHDEKTGVFISVAEDKSNGVTYISQYEVDASGNIKKIVDNIPMIANTMPANVPAGLPKETQKTVQGVVDALMIDKQPTDFIVKTDYQDIPSHSSQEIYEAYKAGRTVKLIRYGEEYRLTNSTSGQSNFKAISFSEEQINEVSVVIKDKALTANVTQFTPPASSVTAVVPDTLSPETNGDVQEILYALAVEADNNKQNVNKKLNLTGGTMQGKIDMASFGIDNLPDAIKNGQPVTFKQLNDAIAGIGTVFNLKGSKPNYAALPKDDNKIGDVWFVEDESVGYIWIEKSGVPQWEKFGPQIDLSGYLTKEGLLQTTGSDTNNTMSQDAITKELGKKQDAGDYALKSDIPEIPAKLPNPNALTFTGASTGEYDGTEAVEINIPTVQDVINALPKWMGGAF